MRLQISIGVLLAVAAASAGAATAPSDAAAQQPYEFCVSGAAKDGRVYISPVFPVALHDVRGEFTQHLVATYGYEGNPARCYSLTPEAQVESFRTQVIEILHWQGRNDILAIDWTPVRGATPTAPQPASGNPDSTSDS